MVRKKGPSMGMVIMRSKSTRRSDPSWANPWTMDVLNTRFRLYVPRAPGMSLVCPTFASSSTRRYPSSVDWQPPCPRLGIIGWAASPQMATHPSLHGAQRRFGSRVSRSGAPSNKSRRLMSPSGVAAMSSIAKSSHTSPFWSPPGRLQNSFRRRASLGYGSSSVGSGSTPPTSSRIRANHCCRFPPPSVETKYLSEPRRIWYDTSSMFEASMLASAA
mmetsp:Transcript_27353/g.61175  ORF Transcript_27353/g.61175 Transcript_27353/m.61175 type:complete len:217 (-) Transcript_27353:1240-1890(-)